MKFKRTTVLAGAVALGLITAPVAAAAPLAQPSAAVAAAAGPAGGVASPSSAYGYTYAGEWAYTADATNDVRSIAVSPKDDVFVLGRDHKIRRYNLNGGLTATWEVPAVQDPYELAVDPRNGDVHVGIWGDVASGEPSGVVVYSRGGSYLKRYTTPVDFTWSTGLAVGADGRSYVANARDDRVYRFSPSGALEGSFGGKGVGSGAFDSPGGVAVAPNGAVYVTDMGNDRVQQFAPDGTFVRAWGQAGYGNGQFMQPNTVAVAPSGNVFVTDLYSRRVQEFTPAGSWVRTFGENHLRKTHGIGFDRHGALYAGGYLESLVEGVAKFAPAAPTGKKTAITVKAKKKTFGKRSKVAITVSKKATGRVTVKAGKKTITGKLKAGKVTVRLPKKGLKPGNRTITVSYAGVPGKFRPSSRTAKVRVVKAKPTVKVKALKKRVKADRKAAFRVTVTAPGVTPGGKVTVTTAGAKARTVKLNKKGRAKVTLTFRKGAKAGKRTLKVTYRGTKLVKKATVRKGTITVRR